MKENSAGFAVYWNVIRSRRVMIVGAALAAGALALVVSLLMPPVYESSLIVEIGEIFIPPEENIKVEAQSIEEPMSAVQILSSPAFLSRVRDELGLKMPLEQMADNLSVEQIVETTRFQRMESPLVKITYEGGDPEFNVKVLEALAGQLIAEHTLEYESSIRMLRERIVSLRDKIAAAARLIERQEEYKQGLDKSIALVEEGVADYTGRLDGIDFAATERTEALFLKSTLNSMKEQIIELRKETNEANLAIGEAEEKIQDYKDRISNLQNLIDLTKNTVIRTRAVVAEEPVRPLVLVNTVAAAALVLLLAVMFAFFQAWARQE
ncbi:MAG TPA: Wzz/FepE/Etk N-terminal domain-containing protein [bacterium]|nr:Wzz/FepE/Etk N-terminal domain-containing protein [bacterium]HPQ67345.1 Wzz/FepE/Etk N-terminal domain-containing protein [bacterium]